MVKIVVLDGYAMNPGDLPNDPLAQLGDLTVYERTPEDQVVERASGAEIVLTNKSILSAESIHQLQKLQYIGVLATGYNVVDLDAAASRGIVVTNVPAYSTGSVAQTVMAHLLNLAQHVEEHSRGVREGRWCKSKDFAYWEYPLVELAGLTMGIVGFGQIGRTVARMAKAFGMRVIVTTRPGSSPPDDGGIETVDLESLFRQSDVISLHCPLTGQTHHLVNKERLSLMKPTAFLINTSRGPVVDEQALADALNSEKIAGAGVDVLSSEPPAEDNPLLSAKNCHITPHLAWATRASRERLMATVVDNVRAFLEGNPQNVIVPKE